MSVSVCVRARAFVCMCVCVCVAVNLAARLARLHQNYISLPRLTSVLTGAHEQASVGCMAQRRTVAGGAGRGAAELATGDPARHRRPGEVITSHTVEIRPISKEDTSGVTSLELPSELNLKFISSVFTIH